MTGCPHDELLMDALEGDVGPVREHLSACSECRGRLDRASAIERLLRKDVRIEAPAAPAHPRPRRPGLAWAAPLAALFLFGAILWWTFRGPTGPGRATPGRPQETEFDRWVGQLEDTNPDVRQAAQEKLVRAGREAEPALRKALASPDTEVRGRAREILDLLPPEFEALRIQPSAALFRFSPDGSSVALYPADDRLELQDAITGKAAWSFPIRLKNLPTLQPAPAFSPDGSRLYTVLEKEKLALLDASKGTALSEFSLNRFEGPLWGKHLSLRPLPHGNLLVDVDNHNSSIYLASREQTYSLPMARRVIDNSEGTLVITLGEKTLYRVDPRTWKSKAMKDLDEPANWIAAPRDFSKLYLASKDGVSVSVLDAATLTLVRRQDLVEDPDPATGLRKWSRPPTCLAVSPEGHWVAVGVSDGTVKIFRAPELKLERTIAVGGEPLHVELTENAALVGVQVGSELKLYRRR